jgi:BirA family biotin operon repressor/biotin-[acetyl-CoA-carboxylase] ligase
MILKPLFPPEWGPRITLTAGVALAEAIRRLGLRPQLKWPNDIMVNHRKVAGILTEARLEKRGFSFVVVGVGINIDTKEKDFPASIREAATALRLVASEPISRVTLCRHVLQELEQWYLLLCQGSFQEILRAWRRYETVIGEMVEVSLSESRLFGVAEDLDQEGRLLVRDKGGRIHQITVGDVVHCRVSRGKNAGDKDLPTP